MFKQKYLSLDINLRIEILNNIKSDLPIIII